MSGTVGFTRVTVLLTDGADHISIDLDTPSPFPVMNYKASARVDAQAGYGVEWCRTALGVEPEVIDTTVRK